MKVGRAALDEDAIRLIEANNPDIEFDWTRILKGDPPVPPEKRRQEPRPEPRNQNVRPRRERVEPKIAAPAPPVEKPPELDEPMTAAQAKLGSEGLIRLRGRYAEMLARISERVPDPERQAELKTLAERLNPDAWVTDPDVLAGLDSYEVTFEAIRSVVGHGRRRGARRGGGEEPAAPRKEDQPAPQMEEQAAPQKFDETQDPE